MILARRCLVATAATLGLATCGQLAQAQATLRIGGANFKHGAGIAVKEINAAGGIQAKTIKHAISGPQSNPGVAEGLASRAIDDGAFAVFGPVFSGSIMVSMAETQRAEVPNFTGSEAAAITRQGNPCIFRTRFMLGVCRAWGRACVEAGKGLSLGAKHSHAWRHGAHSQRRISPFPASTRRAGAIFGAIRRCRLVVGANPTPHRRLGWHRNSPRRRPDPKPDRLLDTAMPKVAKALHGPTVSAAKNPGVIMDVSADNNGDLDRASFVVEVKDGKQIVKETLPALAK